MSGTQPPPEDRASDPAPLDEAALRSLYEEIRRLARSSLRGERVNHTLVPTALANEAYLRLLPAGVHGFASEDAFLAAATTTIRRILVEHARRRASRKRGGGTERSDVDTSSIAAPGVDERFPALEEALEELASIAPEKARLVELRFYGGLSVAECAGILGISERSAAREWRFARAFLQSRLREDAADHGSDS